jgi:hypothetical protein
MKPLSSAGRASADKLIAVASAFVPDGRTQLFDSFNRHADCGRGSWASFRIG